MLHLSHWPDSTGALSGGTLCCLSRSNASVPISERERERKDKDINQHYWHTPLAGRPTTLPLTGLAVSNRARPARPIDGSLANLASHLQISLIRAFATEPQPEQLLEVRALESGMLRPNHRPEWRLDPAALLPNALRISNPIIYPARCSATVTALSHSGRTVAMQ